MKKLSFIFVTAMILSLMIGNFNSSQAITMGNITGQVTDINTNDPIENILVSIQNAENAIVIAEVFTDASGNYDTGELPDGDYRIWFSDPNNVGYFSAIYSSALEFCSADIVSVVSENTAIADQALAPTFGVLVQLQTIDVSGHVSDSSDSLPLGGIQVTLHGWEDGIEFFSTTTDGAGNYNIDLGPALFNSFKIRFSDPLGNYISEYSGAGGADTFCSGTIFSPSTQHTVDEELIELILTPSEQTEELIDETNNIGLPEEVAETLVSPLNQASELLDDNNVNNDRAACGKLSAFIKQAEAQEGKNLSSEQTSQLRDSAVAVKSSLDC